MRLRKTNLNAGRRKGLWFLKRHGRRQGATTLELSLTLGILMSICYGTIEYGYYFYVKNAMDGASREGCRAAIVSGATIAHCNSVIESQLQVAGLVPNGTTASGSGPYTIGNFTVYYTDSTLSTPPAPPGNPSSNISSLSNPGVPTGDEICVTIKATWGVVGAAFRPEALIGSSKTLQTSTTMYNEATPN